MSSHPFDKLSLNDGGTLIFTPCPGTKGTGLRASLAQLAQAGAKGVITLMPDDEMVHNEVTELPQACSEIGLQWFHFPIEDNASPGEAFQRAWEKNKERVFGILNQKGASAIHCKGGSGRTGLMAAIILLERGMPYEQAVAQVKSLRPNALQLTAHTDYLAQNYDDGIESGLSNRGNQ